MVKLKQSLLKDDLF